MNRDALLALADKWEKAGERTRPQNADVASALIGCAQALRNLLDES